MLDQVDALRALHETGTMAKAAVRLRLTQSAVSKRIAGLEEVVGQPLIEREGRRVRLTPAGLRVLDEVAPAAAALRDKLREVSAGTRGVVRVGATESLLGSWLPDCLRVVAAAHPEVGLELHAHRGPWVVQRLRAAEIDLAVCVGSGEDGLALRELGEEPLVLVAPRGGGLGGAAAPGRRGDLGSDAAGEAGPVPGGRVPVITIENASHTGAWLGRRLHRLSEALGLELEPGLRIESFTSAVALSQAGFGHALVPLGIALAMGVPAERVRRVPGAGRPIALYTRAGAQGRPVVERFADGLEAQVRLRLREITPGVRRSG